MRWPSVLLLCGGLSLVATFATGCKKTGCLGGEADCRVPAPCTGLPAATCAAGEQLSVRTLGAGEAGTQGLDALGRAGDIVLSNDQVVAVIAGLGNQNYLDVNGGSLLDLSTRGLDNDGINQVLQVVGILPDDSPYYTSLEIIDERPARIAVQLRGTLYHRPDVPIYTIYELRGCESGLRMRTEIVNKTPDPQLWSLSDGFYWSGRSLQPFAPAPGIGFTHPPLDLLKVNDSYSRYPYLAASTHASNPSTYSLVACNVGSLEGFNSPQVSTAGLVRTVVDPRDYLIYERFLSVAPRGDIAGAADVALEVRRALFGEEIVTLKGSIVRSPPEFPTEAQTSILISEGNLSTPLAERVPYTQIVPDDQGRFSARLPQGKRYVLTVDSFGRQRIELEVGALNADKELPAIALPPLSAKVSLSVEDAISRQPIDAEIFVVPVDPSVDEATKGSFYGLTPRCAPYLGAPDGPSPACNRVLVPRTGAVTVEVPIGRYRFYAYHGPFSTLGHQILDVSPGQNQALNFALEDLDLLDRGALSADFHVHGGASFDSSIPDADRVLAFAAADMDVLIATDHDVVTDYGPTLAALGLDDHISVVSGVETTGHVPFFTIPGDVLPLVIGHYNFWPLAYDPTKPRNGGPFDEFLQPGELFDRTEPLFTAPGIIQLNHPWGNSEAGRDLGYPRALGLSALRDLPASDDGTVGGMFVRAPNTGGHSNHSHHTQEVMNGTANDQLLQYRAFWFYMLNQGLFKTGTANSDSHGLTDNTIGSPRSIVLSDVRPGPSFDITRFNDAVRKGRVLGTNGPLITAEIENSQGTRVPFGSDVIAVKPNSVLYFDVVAAPWIPVEEIRFVVNGKVVLVVPSAEIQTPGDPFGNIGVRRYPAAAYRLDLILPKELPADQDIWLVIEAGAKLPLSGDLGGPNGEPDGIPDTSDNNADGVVDARDVEPGKSYGPLKNPATPVDASAPSYHFSRVVQGGYPFAFTNPFLLDRNGNGVFDAPKAGGAK